MNIGDVYYRNMIFTGLVHYIIVESNDKPTTVDVTDVYYNTKEKHSETYSGSYASRGHLTASFTQVTDPAEIKFIKMLAL